MKFALCLLALAAATKAQADAPAAADGADETYAPETESYAAPTYSTYKAPEICLGSCPRSAPCQNPHTGGCMPSSCASYEPAVAYTAEEGTGYRRLTETYGEEEPETYAPTYAAYAPRDCGCPAGTKDVWGCSRLNKRVTLWVAFALLIAPAAYFFYKAWERDTATLKIDDHTRMHRIVAGGICFIASLAYLTMALGYGYTIRCCDGREFYYARYVDWAITTPMMIWELVHINAGVIKDSEKAFMYAIDILMIISGLIGALICQDHKWAFFGFSILTFIPLLWFLCNLRSRAKEEENRTYNQIATITVVTWFFYPIVWIFAEGTDKLCAQGEAICYTVLDIISKSVFGWIIVNSAPVKSAVPIDSGSSML